MEKRSRVYRESNSKFFFDEKVFLLKMKREYFFSVILRNEENLIVKM